MYIANHQLLNKHYLPNVFGSRNTFLIKHFITHAFEKCWCHEERGLSIVVKCEFTLVRLPPPLLLWQVAQVVTGGIYTDSYIIFLTSLPVSARCRRSSGFLLAFPIIIILILISSYCWTGTTCAEMRIKTLTLKQMSQCKLFPLYEGYLQNSGPSAEHHGT
jgi:hypothetical protein